MMTREDEDYSDYSRHLNAVITGTTLINGFIFTAIITFLTRLSQPLAFYSQALLLLLVVLFYLNSLLIEHLTAETLFFCRRVPPKTRKIIVRIALIIIIASLFGFSIPLMFLVYDLIFLATVSTVIWILIIAANLALIYKPIMDFRKKQRD
jgi:hypothetical protein